MPAPTAAQPLPANGRSLSHWSPLKCKFAPGMLHMSILFIFLKYVGTTLCNNCCKLIEAIKTDDRQRQFQRHSHAINQLPRTCSNLFAGFFPRILIFGFLLFLFSAPPEITALGTFKWLSWSFKRVTGKLHFLPHPKPLRKAWPRMKPHLEVCCSRQPQSKPPHERQLPLLGQLFGFWWLLIF